jgi:hypothetical protein
MPAACAHAAREGAAVLAAWSIDLEGEQPGALARASRQLALLMLAAGRPDNAVGWLLVCRELGLLAGEIGRGVPRPRRASTSQRDRDRPARRARADPRTD